MSDDIKSQKEIPKEHESRLVVIYINHNVEVLAGLLRTFEPSSIVYSISATTLNPSKR